MAEHSFTSRPAKSTLRCPVGLVLFVLTLLNCNIVESNVIGPNEKSQINLEGRSSNNLENNDRILFPLEEASRQTSKNTQEYNNFEDIANMKNIQMVQNTRNQTLKEKLEALEKKINNLETSSNNLEENVDKINTLYEKLNKMTQSLQEKASTAEGCCNNLKANLEAQHNALEEQLKKISAKNEDKINGIERSLQSITNNNIDQRKQNEKVDALLEKVQDEINSAQRSLTNFTSNIDEKQNSLYDKVQDVLEKNKAANSFESTDGNVPFTMSSFLHAFCEDRRKHSTKDKLGKLCLQING